MKDARETIYVAGHRGLVGSALVRGLRAAGYARLLEATHQELDLRVQADVNAFFAAHKPDVVFLAAAIAGGIKANNTHRWSFLYDNLAIQNNVLSAALEQRTRRVVFFGSSCIYPRLAPQPIREDYLLTGPLEATNEPYAVAKIAGLKLVEAANAQMGRTWISLMPTNLYGPGDRFDIEAGHVLPAMIAKFHAAKVRHAAGDRTPVVLWGSGTALRELLHVDDLAAAALMLMNSGETGLFNVGYGSDVSIRELAELVAKVTGYTGRVEWDATQPDGTPRKLLDSSRVNALGWKPRIELGEGIAATYRWFLEHVARAAA